MSTLAQQDLPFRKRGGARPGAGRPRTSSPSEPGHLARPAHRPSHPVHVVLRVKKGVPRLRTRATYAVLRRAIRLANGRASFRVVHASLQHNHVHLLVEAGDSSTLSRGVQALAISTARGINRAHHRRGSVFAFRFHATEIRSPRQARSALAYVLNNWRRHREDLGRPSLLDPFSSALAFDGWRARFHPPPPTYEPLPVARAQTWLLATGWRRHGALDPRAVPRGGR